MGCGIVEGGRRKDIVPSVLTKKLLNVFFYSPTRSKLAKKSLDFHCEHCGRTADLLSRVGPTADDRNEAVQAEAREIATQVRLKRLFTDFFR